MHITVGASVSESFMYNIHKTILYMYKAKSYKAKSLAYATT